MLCGEWNVLHRIKLFSVSYFVSNDGDDSVSDTHFHTYTACTQTLAVEEVLVTFLWFLLWITTAKFPVV